jgi:hypothetical protein
MKNLGTFIGIALISTSLLFSSGSSALGGGCSSQLDREDKAQTKYNIALNRAFSSNATGTDFINLDIAATELQDAQIALTRCLAGSFEEYDGEN